MTIALIGGLMIVAVYFGKRWLDANAEIADLRVQVASLKRMLAKRRS